MNAALAQRQFALAGIALLAGLFAVAFKPGGVGPHLPKSVPAAGGGWNKALAATGGDSFTGIRTDCGYTINAESLGLANPTLPCNTKIYIVYKGRKALTQVIAKGGSTSGQFELTPALARLLGMSGTQQIMWRYAAR